MRRGRSRWERLKDGCAAALAWTLEGVSNALSCLCCWWD